MKLHIDTDDLRHSIRIETTEKENSLVASIEAFSFALTALSGSFIIHAIGEPDETEMRQMREWIIGLYTVMFKSLKGTAENNGQVAVQEKELESGG